jgi:hypothetical protein
MLYGNKNLPTFKKKKVDTEDQNDKQLAKDLFGSDDESPKKKPSSSKAKLPKVDTSAKLSREMEMELFGTISSEEEVVISKPRPQVVVINSSDDDLVTSVKRPLVRTSGSEMTPPSASKQKVLKKRRVEDSNPAIVIPSSQSPASRQFKPVQPKASNSSKSFGLPTFKKLVSAPSLHRPSPHSSPKKTIQTEFPSYRKQTTTIEKPKQDPLPEARKVPTDPIIRGIDTIETDSPQRISTESQRAPTMQTTLTYEPFRPSTSQSANQKTHFVLESDDSDEDQTPKPLDIRMNF